MDLLLCHVTVMFILNMFLLLLLLLLFFWQIDLVVISSLISWCKLMIGLGCEILKGCNVTYSIFKKWFSSVGLFPLVPNNKANMPWQVFWLAFIFSPTQSETGLNCTDIHRQPQTWMTITRKKSHNSVTENRGKRGRRKSAIGTTDIKLM